MIQSKCCNTTELIEPDWDMAEKMGSMWRAYACYICKKCGKACDIIQTENTDENGNKN